MSTQSGSLKSYLCPDLSGPTHNTVTMYARLAMSFFALSNALILVLRPILVKLHILTRLMESFRMVYELWPWIEGK